MLSSFRTSDREVEQQLREAVAKAESDLAQCIDEVVYSEKRRAAAEEAVKAMSGQVTMDRELLKCIDTLLVYISVLEHRVLLPAATSLNAVVAEAATEARDDAARRLEIINVVVSADTPYAVKRALSLSEPPPTVASHSLVKRHEILSHPSPLTLEDNYVALCTLMSATQELRALANEALGLLAASQASQQHQERSATGPDWGTRSASPSTTAATTAHKELSQAVNAIKYSRDLLEEVIQLNREGGAQIKLVDRIRELEEVVRAHEAERQEVASRFQVLQRALESAKALEKEHIREAAAAEDVELLRIQTQHQAETIRNQQNELLALGRDLRETKASYEEQVRKLKKQLSDTIQYQSVGDVDAFIQQVETGASSSALHAPGGSRSTSNPASGGGAATPSASYYQNKLKAFEMTVTALNSELAVLEDKIIALERKADDEAAESAKKLAEAKRQHQEELDECDQVVTKLTAELETLIKENMSLRQRLKRAESHSS